MADVIRVEGAKALDAALGQLADDMQAEILMMAAEAGAEVLQAGMERRAPRRTGELAGGIGIKVRETAEGAEADIGPTKDAFYGMFQELGTVRHAAQPFMRPTLDEDGAAAVTEVARVLKAEIDARATAAGPGI